jgi:hypothetical protein
MHVLFDLGRQWSEKVPLTSIREFQRRIDDLGTDGIAASKKLYIFQSAVRDLVINDKSISPSISSRFS